MGDLTVGLAVDQLGLQEFGRLQCEGGVHPSNVTGIVATHEAQNLSQDDRCLSARGGRAQINPVAVRVLVKPTDQTNRIIAVCLFEPIGQRVFKGTCGFGRLEGAERLEKLASEIREHDLSLYVKQLGLLAPAGCEPTSNTWATRQKRYSYSVDQKRS